jgi:hypothetical protein
MQNPYDYRNPVSNRDLFFGRTSLLAKIYARIGADRPQSVSIVGEPKIGKSSLLWYLATEETRQAFLKNPDDYFYIYIPIGLEKNLSYENFYGSLYSLISKKTMMATEIRKAEPSYDLLKGIIENLNHQDKKIILLFDDFHLITQNETFPLEFFSFMRSLANNYNLAFVTSSFMDLQKLCVSKDIEESPFFNIFTNITLKPLEQEEAIQLIEEPFQKAGISVNSESQLIMDIAGHFPYMLQVACSLLFDMKLERSAFDEADLKAWEEKFWIEVESYFNSIWQSFNEDQKEILHLVMRSRKIDKAKKYALNDLIRRNYVVMRDHRPQLYSPMFEKLIEQMDGNERSYLSRFMAWIRRLQVGFNKAQ